MVLLLSAFIVVSAQPAVELPLAVKTTVERAYPKASVKKWKQETEHGKVIFEVVVQSVEGPVELSVEPGGKLLSEERVISAAALPKAVRAGLDASAFGKGVIERVEQISEGGKLTYEILVRAPDGSRVEAVFSDSGALVSSEAKKKGAD